MLSALFSLYFNPLCGLTAHPSLVPTDVCIYYHLHTVALSVSSTLSLHLHSLSKTIFLCIEIVLLPLARFSLQIGSFNFHAHIFICQLFLSRRRLVPIRNKGCLAFTFNLLMSKNHHLRVLIVSLKPTPLSDHRDHRCILFIRIRYWYCCGSVLHPTF